MLIVCVPLLPISLSTKVVTDSVGLVLVLWGIWFGFQYIFNHVHTDMNSKLDKGGRRFQVFLLLDQMCLNTQSASYKQRVP